MVGPRAVVRGVGGCVDSGEGAKLIGEVGLVVKAAFDGQFRPWQVNTGMQLPDGALEAEDARKDFGGEADLFAEDLGESALAQASGAGNLTNCSDVGGLPESREREFDDWVAGETRVEAVQQELLQNAEFGLGAGKFVQAIAQAAYGGTPDAFKIDAAVAEQVGAVADEGREPAGLEDNPDKVRHVRGFYNLVDGTGSDYECGGLPDGLAAFRTVEQEIASQVEDDLNAAGGQNALAAVVRIRHLRVPKRLDAAVKRRDRDVLKVDHPSWL